MRHQLEDRLKELKSEFELGQDHLAEAEAQVTQLRLVLLRISGAIQVLEEELGKAAPPGTSSSAQPAAAGD